VWFVPDLRFPEFTDEWERKKFRDVCNITTGNKNTQDKSNDGIYPFYVRSQIVERINSWTFDGEAILTAGDGVGVGKVFHYSTGKIGVHQRVYILSDFKCDGKYLYSYFAGHFYNRVKRMSAKNSVDSVRMEMIADMPISLPSTEEQKKIGHLLALLDERIATQTKIIEDLKKLKSAIIENVLNSGHCVNLRLGDVGAYIRGLTYNSNDVIDYNGTLVMRSNNIINGSQLDYNNNVVSVNKQISQEQQLQDGDIVICMANGSSALVGKSSFYDGKCLSPITVGAFCGIYRSKMPITKWLFQTNRYRRYIWNSLQGGNGAIANLNGEDILRMLFPLPDKQTTDRCTKLLSSLDSLIESNVSLCLKYSQQKEYLLRQMFI
jgi:restriction endonuclease S subunit